MCTSNDNFAQRNYLGRNDFPRKFEKFQCRVSPTCQKRPFRQRTLICDAVLYRRNKMLMRIGRKHFGSAYIFLDVSPNFCVLFSVSRHQTCLTHFLSKYFVCVLSIYFLMTIDTLTWGRRHSFAGWKKKTRIDSEWWFLNGSGPNCFREIDERRWCRIRWNMK